ncbi:hypothetical protein [Bacillus wiedmannii]|uniref:hypothetical protein n=1 Tax=Bacillus wiedmannii TaxID=1890302 RepID=UPI000B441BEF|nr:hypothetical protein BK740_02495 [Bacillus thuringiensis serovar argentinensis]
MFKQGILSFLLFILVISSFNGIASAETSVQENITKKFYAYDEPSFTSPKSNWGNQFNPQVVTVKEKRSNGWWKIATSQGDKWISLNGEVKSMSKAFYAYNEPSFSSAKANMGVQLNPQNVNVRDGNTDGWLKIVTWEGDKWINPNMEEIQVKEKFNVYNEPSLIAQKGNNGNQYNPQFVVVKEQRSDGWWRISTAEGDKWVAINGIRINVDVNFSTFNEPFIEADRVAQYGPQTIVAYDGKKTEQGTFYLIGTHLGKKWMSLDAEKEFNEKREPMRQSLGYNENDLDFDSIKVEQAAQARAFVESASDSTMLKPEQKQLRIPSKEEIEEFRKSIEPSNDGQARSFAARAMPDNWVRKGDVIYTPNSRFGPIAGHTAIIAKDPMDGKDYQIVHAPGTDEYPAVQMQELSKWEFIHKGNPYYKRFFYFRHPNRSVGAAAGNYAYNHFYQNRYNYKYDIFSTSAKVDSAKTYCSKLVYLAYRDGAGVDLFPTQRFYIVHPADFLFTQHKLGLYFVGEGGTWG